MLHDPDVLDETAVPEHELVVHRQDALRRLSQSFRRESSGDLAYLLGPTGTGKTMCARLEVSKRGETTGPRSSYVNCWQIYERNDILYHVVDDLCDGVVHRTSTPRGELVDRLNTVPDERRFVILDEADQLHDKAIIYDLIEAPDLLVVLIANNEDDLFDDVDDRLRSRLAVGTRIDFEAYTARQLSEILAKRAEYAFRDGSVVDDRQLDTIAEHADGDARVAIRALFEATTSATEAGRRTIADSDIEAAIPEARQALRQKSVEQLNDHQRAVYDVIAEEGPVAPKDVYAGYCSRVDDPRTDRTVRKYLSKLARYNLVSGEGKKSDRRYTVVRS